MAELNSAEEIVLYCSTGMRSALAARLLRRAGFFRVASLRGGLAALREHYAETGA